MKASGNVKSLEATNDSSHTSVEVLEKHKKYESMYGKNELFWGLGIECESYLEMSKPVFVKPGFMINNHSRERYSVDYYTSYKKETLAKALSKFQHVKEDIPLPMLINSHALTKMDAQFEPQTLYKSGAPPNPKFSGRTIFDDLKQLKPEYFEDQYEKTFVFDGDSIEIMTQNFYNTTVEKVVEELEKSRKEFIENLQACFCAHKTLNRYCDIKWTSGNHGFAVMSTNPNNLAIFNNGTYHINITLPTLLDEHGKIKDWKAFQESHRNYIRYIQWMEPLLVGNFGSPDPLAWLIEEPYSLGSQRAAMSRYIGLGTYDTSIMKRGKILTVDLSGVQSFWYSKYHTTSGYVGLDKVGLDINFNKHWNHGVEIRFFDWFPEQRLNGLLKFLVYLADVSLTKPCAEEPVTSHVWNRWMIRVIEKGSAAGCNEGEAKVLTNILGFPCKPAETLEILFADIFSDLTKQFPYGLGGCSKYFLEESKKINKKAKPEPTRQERTVEEVPIQASSWKCC